MKLDVKVIVIILLIAGFTIQSIRLSYKKDEVIVDNSEAILTLVRAELAENKKHTDSLFFRLSAKKQTIINNEISYEIQNKNTAVLDSSSTDSIFRINLQSDYKRFGWMLIN